MAAAVAQKPVHDIDFPFTLGPSIRVSSAELSLSFPLDKLSTLQRQAWGIRSSATSVLIYLVFQIINRKKSARFCIHMPPDDGENDGYHRHRYAYGQWSNVKVCSGKSNILTYVLDRELHQLLRTNTEPQDIYQKAASIIYSARPGSKCVVCRKDFDKAVRLWRPLPCSIDCQEMFEASSIDTRISALTGDPVALDFLLGCIDEMAKQCYAVQQYLPGEDAGKKILKRLPGCPIPANILSTVIESFPALTSETAWDAILDDSDQGHNRRNLLSWLAGHFQGFLASAPQETRISGCGNAHQFLMLNSTVSREVSFSKVKAPWQGAFHGTRAQHAFSILSDGLKDLSADPNALYSFNAPGIFVSSQAQVSIRGYTSALTGWKNSRFHSHRILLGCALADPAYSSRVITKEYTFKKQDRVMVRYVFVIPESDVFQAAAPGSYMSFQPSLGITLFSHNVVLELEKSINALRVQGIL